MTQNKSPINSDGGPSSYYDFALGWRTWNDFADYKATEQWKEHSFHLGNVGKVLCRWGDKSGTSKAYDARKIVYSGLRVLLMLEGKESVSAYLESLANDEQFKQGKVTKSPKVGVARKLRDLDLKAGDLVELVSLPTVSDEWFYPPVGSIREIREDGSWCGVNKKFLPELEGLFRKVDKPLDNSLNKAKQFKLEGKSNDK